MKLFVQLSLLLLFIGNGTSLFSQSERIYFDRKWERCEKKKGKFYRIYTLKDSIIEVKNYYANGKIQFIGKCKNNPINIRDISQIGEFETHCFGRTTYFKRNGNIDVYINYTPFDSLYGVSKEDLALLDSITLSDSIRSQLVFAEFVLKNSTESTFAIDDRQFFGYYRIVSRKSRYLSMNHYCNGKLSGTSYGVDPKGITWRTREYVNDKKHGEDRIYNWEGKLRTIKTYENGKLIKKKRIIGM